MQKFNLPNKVKEGLKKLPGAKTLNNLRHKVIRARELSDLVTKKQIVTFPSYENIPEDDEMGNELVKEVIKEWLDLYGIVNLKKQTRLDLDLSNIDCLLWHPMALLQLPLKDGNYLHLVNRETRRLLRVAQREGYEFREFDWDDHLSEIYDINTSKEKRQGEPMRGWYRNPVQSRQHNKEEMRYKKYLGGFREGKLLAYFHYYLCGKMAVGKHFLGHADHLRNGIMYGLMCAAVEYCINHESIDWIIYGDWQRTGSLKLFKQHLGFNGYAMLLDFSRDRELLDYSRDKVSYRLRI